MSTNVMIRPPRTMLEVYQSLPEGTRVQLIENNLMMSPSPLERHQRILSEIYLQLGPFVKKHHLGETRMAPYDVYLGKKNVIQPDILFISRERLSLIRENGLHGAPDLVIEILSPETAKYDQEDKKVVYERYGVKEYWIVDPATGSVQGFYLGDGEFVEQPAANLRIDSRLLNHIFDF